MGEFGFFASLTLLLVFFAGEPDIKDAIVFQLTGEKTWTTSP